MMHPPEVDRFLSMATWRGHTRSASRKEMSRRRAALLTLAIALPAQVWAAENVRFLVRKDYGLASGVSAVGLVGAQGARPRLVAATDKGLLQLPNDGAGGFSAPEQVPSEAFVKTFAIGDFDGDGYRDVAYPDRANKVVE